MLSVQDNGEGIPQEILDRLNSPDREMPAGHLGLRNVDRIVRPAFTARKVRHLGKRCARGGKLRRAETADEDEGENGQC